MSDFWVRMLAWLEQADLSYLSARALFLCGLPTGERLAVEAYESVIRLLLAVELRRQGRELGPGEMRELGRDLEHLSAMLAHQVPDTRDEERAVYLRALHRYGDRYPTHWPIERVVAADIEALDHHYASLRNRATTEFPDEYGVAAGQMLPNLAAGFTESLIDVLHGLGGASPGEVLRLDNEALSRLRALPPP